MPNWTAIQITLTGKHEDIESVLKLVLIGKDFIESVRKDEFDLCKHIKSHPNYTEDDRKVCDGCEHCGICPLLSPKGDDANEWNMAKVKDYGLHPDGLQEGHIYFGILIPQPKEMYNGGTNRNVELRNRRFGIIDWFDWNHRMWGTCKNPCHDDTRFEWVDDTTAELSFWSAWSLPEPWLRKLSEECLKHDVYLEGRFADDDFHGRMGEFNNDECNVEDPIYLYDLDLDTELYAKVWGEEALQRAVSDDEDDDEE